MIRKACCALVFAVACVGLAGAEEFSAIITKVEGKKVTFHKTTFKDKKFEKGEEMTLPVADDVKVITGKYNREEKKFEDPTDVKGGLESKTFKEIDEKGRLVRITTSEDNKSITRIGVFQFGGKKKGGGKKPADQ